jgi:hypothetical protein
MVAIAIASYGNSAYHGGTRVPMVQGYVPWHGYLNIVISTMVARNRRLPMVATQRLAS